MPHTDEYETRWSLPLQAGVPVILFAVGTLLQYSGLDEWLVRPFFDETTRTWPLASNWWLAGLIHVGGRDLIATLLAGLCLVLGLSFMYRPLACRRRKIAYLLFGALAGIGIVALLKGTTHIYSPEDLIEYGGTMPHIRVFDPVPPGLPVGHAFPAGHASGAFALVGFYFLLAARRSRWRYLALGACLALGFTFGFAQQIRGKHFLSHDLFALGICWGAALVLLFVMRLHRGHGAAGYESNP